MQPVERKTKRWLFKKLGGSSSIGWPGSATIRFAAASDRTPGETEQSCSSANSIYNHRAQDRTPPVVTKLCHRHSATLAGRPQTYSLKIGLNLALPNLLELN